MAGLTASLPAQAANRPIQERNPYLDAFLVATHNDVPGRHGMFVPGIYEARERLVKRYAWAVPDDNAIRVIAQLGPVLEMGAGSGYWASLLASIGTDVHAYDIVDGRKHYNFTADYHLIVRHEPDSATIAAICQANRDRTLLLVWPPYDHSFAYQCAHAYLKAGGKRIVYVGEDSYGCTGDAAFHRLLAMRCTHRNTYSIPQWPGMHDTLSIYTRR